MLHCQKSTAHDGSGRPPGPWGLEGLKSMNLRRWEVIWTTHKLRQGVKRGVPRYRVTLLPEGDFPPHPNLSPLSIGSGIGLFLENNGWRVKLELEASDNRDALEKSRNIANNSLALFQVFSTGATNYFTIYIPDGAGGTVVELSSGGRGVISNSLTVNVGASASASVVNVEQFRANLTQIVGVEALTLEEDCEIILYYYSTAMKESNDTYKFLNLITAIEAMLSEVSETTEKISRRLAVLASSKFSNMQETFEQFKRFYGTRSDILHGEKVPAISKETVGSVGELTQIAVRNYLLLRRSHNNQQIKQLLDKFFDQNSIGQIREQTAL
jgi:hypothetical protein